MSFGDGEAKLRAVFWGGEDFCFYNDRFPKSFLLFSACSTVSSGLNELKALPRLDLDATRL